MSISSYRKEVTPGKFKTLYVVIAESLNKYSGKRVQRKRRGIESLPKAERIYRELWNQCREEYPSNIRFNKWSELVEKYCEDLDGKIRSPENPNGMSRGTVSSKKSRFKHLSDWNDFHMELITPQLLISKLDDFESKGFGRSFTNSLIKEVRTIFSYAWNLGALERNLFFEMKRRKESKKLKPALTHPEADKLLFEAKNQNHPYFKIWLLSLFFGCRRSELAGLRWSDIDFENGLVRFTRQDIPGEGIVERLKDKEDRVVAIPAPLMPLLKELKLQSTSDLVVDMDCHKWKGGHQADVLKDFCKKIGIKEVTHHQLRASHITLALADGIPLGIVKENVGHANLKTTDGYFRSSGILLKGQMDGFKIKVPQLTEATIHELKLTKG